ncbi:hypothetical protein PM082_010155 [Marasmius tenuissimus]|nr:hypothetical protein PM082_010155 [Marasmius tenuissimus]
MPDKVEVTRVKITEFSDYIRQRPSEYKDCSVITVTHVKDMNNWVLHEYLHVVIWNPHTTSWRRLIAERNDIQDQMCIGEYPWIKSNTSSPPRIKETSGSVETSGNEAIAKVVPFGELPLVHTASLVSFSNSSSPGGGDRLPLPMRYVEFGEGSLSLEHMADVLLKVHKSQPKYTWYCYNCYWYCEAIFVIMRRGRQWKKLKWARLQKAFWIGIFVRKAPRDEANRYNGKVLPAVPISANPWASGHNLQEAKVDASAESQPKTDYQQAEAFVTELQLEDPEFWDNLDQKIDVSETREAYKKLKEELMSFSQAVLSDPHKDENLEAYRSIQAENDNQDEGDTPFDPLEQKIRDSLEVIAGPDAMTGEEKARYDEALRAFVGSVIKDLPEQGVEA